eukprot:COSAG01_NODE_6375_length_3705_cov_2.301442_5_plen_85_part_00
MVDSAHAYLLADPCSTGASCSQIRAGDTALEVTLFDPHMANQSKGRMGQLMSNKERDKLRREIEDSMARSVCGLRFTSRVIFVL